MISFSLIIAQKNAFLSNPISSEEEARYVVVKTAKKLKLRLSSFLWVFPRTP